MKRIIAMGAAFVLMLSAGTTVSASGHHACVGRMLQSSALCQGIRILDGGGHHLRHDGGQDCVWRADVDKICEQWAHHADRDEAGETCELPDMNDGTGHHGSNHHSHHGHH